MKGLKLYAPGNLTSKPEFHGCWQNTRDSRIRNEELYCSWHRKQRGYQSTYIVPLVPNSTAQWGESQVKAVHTSDAL